MVAQGTIEEGMAVIANEKLKLEKEVTSSEGKMVDCCSPKTTNLHNIFFILENPTEDHKCMVKLMKISLGLNEQTAENLLSPKSKKAQKIPEEF